MSFLTPILSGIPALFEGVTAGGVVKGGLAAASIGAGLVGAAGARQQGESAAQAAEFNARGSQQQAGREREAAGLEATEFAKKQRRQLATSRAGRLASGVTMSGSPLLVDEDTINEIAFNEALIRSGGETRATRLEQESTLQRSRAKSDRTASYYRAGSSLLGSARDLTFLYGNA